MNEMKQNTAVSPSDDTLLMQAAVLIMEEDWQIAEEGRAQRAEAPAAYHQRTEQLIQQYTAQQKKKRLAALGKIAASLVVAVFLGYTLLTLDASANPLHYFGFLVKGDGNSFQILPQETGSDSLTGTERSAPCVPEDWSFPVSPTWIPARLSELEAVQLRRSASISYSGPDTEEYLSLSISDAQNPPVVDGEDAFLADEFTMDGAQCQLYYYRTGEYYGLILLKDSYVVHIAGNVSRDEICRVAASLKFE